MYSLPYGVCDVFTVIALGSPNGSCKQAAPINSPIKYKIHQNNYFNFETSDLNFKLNNSKWLAMQKSQMIYTIQREELRKRRIRTILFISDKNKECFSNLSTI